MNDITIEHQVHQSVPIGVFTLVAMWPFISLTRTINKNETFEWIKLTATGRNVRSALLDLREKSLNHDFSKLVSAHVDTTQKHFLWVCGSMNISRNVLL